jgi:hypothetical protein
MTRSETFHVAIAFKKTYKSRYYRTYANDKDT